MQQPSSRRRRSSERRTRCARARASPPRVHATFTHLDAHAAAARPPIQRCPPVVRTRERASTSRRPERERTRCAARTARGARVPRQRAGGGGAHHRILRRAAQTSRSHGLLNLDWKPAPHHENLQPDPSDFRRACGAAASIRRADISAPSRAIEEDFIEAVAQTTTREFRPAPRLVAFGGGGGVRGSRRRSKGLCGRPTCTAASRRRCTSSAWRTQPHLAIRRLMGCDGEENAPTARTSSRTQKYRSSTLVPRGGVQGRRRRRRRRRAEPARARTSSASTTASSPSSSCREAAHAAAHPAVDAGALVLRMSHSQAADVAAPAPAAAARAPRADAAEHAAAPRRPPPLVDRRDPRTTERGVPPGQIEAMAHQALFPRARARRRRAGRRAVYVATSATRPRLVRAAGGLGAQHTPYYPDQARFGPCRPNAFCGAESPRI